MSRGGHAQHSPARSRALLAGVAAIALIAAVSVYFTSASSGDHRQPTSSTKGRSVPATRATTTMSTTEPATTTTSTTQVADPLAGLVASYIATRKGKVLAAVDDLTTGQTWTTGDGPPQDEASIVKVNILETLLAQRGAATLSSTDESLATSMIEESDNGSATDLWDDVGAASGIRVYDQSLGLRDTTPSPCVVCSGFPWPGWGLTTTTPTDQIALLKALVEPGQTLTTSEQSFVLRLMENVTPSERWGVSSGVPADATVALKNGWLPLNDSDTDWQINSIGWVSGDGRNYLIAVLSTDNPDEDYGIDTIDDISMTVWSDLG
jgi:Beta-lactamase enzyme family